MEGKMQEGEGRETENRERTMDDGKQSEERGNSPGKCALLR